MILTLNPRRVLRILLVIIAVLTMCNLGVVIATHILGHARLFGLAQQLNMDLEANIPTYFSSMQLAFCAVVLWVIARMTRAAGGRFATHWLILAAVFAYLSLDEAAGFHEMVGYAMRDRFVFTGIWFYAWYVPYGCVLIGLAVAYWKFFWHLPAATRRRFVWAGAVFLIGAVGVEMLGSSLWTATEWTPPVHKFRMALAYSAEEPLEMLGIALFAYAALEYVAAQGTPARIELCADAEAAMRSKPPVASRTSR